MKERRINPVLDSPVPTWTQKVLASPISISSVSLVSLSSRCPVEHRLGLTIGRLGSCLLLARNKSISALKRGTVSTAVIGYNDTRNDHLLKRRITCPIPRVSPGRAAGGKIDSLVHDPS